jgi:hypothetical protein
MIEMCNSVQSENSEAPTPICFIPHPHPCLALLWPVAHKKWTQQIIVQPTEIGHMIHKGVSQTHR